MHPISLDTQQNILLSLQKGLSTRNVALLHNVSQGKVHKLCKAHLPDLTLSLGGRPPKLSQQNKHYCIRAVTSGKLKTAVAVQQELAANLDIKVNERTIRRVLQDSGLQARKKEKRPQLSMKNIRERLEFAKYYKD